jgi:hypothetical protein
VYSNIGEFSSNDDVMSELVRLPGRMYFTLDPEFFDEDDFWNLTWEYEMGNVVAILAVA